jgi:hypothetical protein
LDGQRLHNERMARVYVVMKDGLAFAARLRDALAHGFAFPQARVERDGND